MPAHFSADGVGAQRATGPLLITAAEVSGAHKEFIPPTLKCVWVARECINVCQVMRACYDYFNSGNLLFKRDPLTTISDERSSDIHQP